MANARKACRGAGPSRTGGVKIVPDSAYLVREGMQGDKMSPLRKEFCGKAR